MKKVIHFLIGGVNPLAVIITTMIVTTLIILHGCAGMQLDSPTAGMSAYLAGRSFGAGVSEWAPDAADIIEVNWTKMITRKNENGMLPDPIPADYIMPFFTDAIDIVKVFYSDPYALTSDFKAVLRNYGGVIDKEGKLLELQPIPRSIMMEVANGWAASRNMYFGRKVIK